MDKVAFYLLELDNLIALLGKIVFDTGKNRIHNLGVDLLFGYIPEKLDICPIFGNCGDGTPLDQGLFKQFFVYPEVSAQIDCFGLHRQRAPGFNDLARYFPVHDEIGIILACLGHCTLKLILFHGLSQCMVYIICGFIKGPYLKVVDRLLNGLFSGLIPVFDGLRNIHAAVIVGGNIDSARGSRGSKAHYLFFFKRKLFCFNRS